MIQNLVVKYSRIFDLNYVSRILFKWKICYVFQALNQWIIYEYLHKYEHLMGNTKNSVVKRINNANNVKFVIYYTVGPKVLDI